MRHPNTHVILGVMATLLVSGSNLLLPAKTDANANFIGLWRDRAHGNKHTGKASVRPTNMVAPMPQWRFDRPQ